MRGKIINWRFIRRCVRAPRSAAVRFRFNISFGYSGFGACGYDRIGSRDRAHIKSYFLYVRRACMRMCIYMHVWFILVICYIYNMLRYYMSSARRHDDSYRCVRVHIYIASIARDRACTYITRRIYHSHAHTLDTCSSTTPCDAYALSLLIYRNASASTVVWCTNYVHLLPSSYPTS